MYVRALSTLGGVLISCSVLAQIAVEGDVTIPGYSKEQLEKLEQPYMAAPLRAPMANADQNNFTVIPYDYAHQSKKEVEALIDSINNNSDLNDKIAGLATHKYIQNRPYNASGVQGEDDWVLRHGVIKYGQAHIKQDPIYRTDRYVCNTLVQNVLGIINSKNIEDFEHKILKINYGQAGSNSAGHYPDSPVHYYNRNNFVSAGFNPVNQENGYIVDGTSGISGSIPVKMQQTTVTVRNWLNKQKSNPTINVRVFDPKNGSDMVDRFIAPRYPVDEYKNLESYPVKIPYIPKENLVIKQGDEYIPNQLLLQDIPTPSVIEIIRNDQKWLIGGRPISDVIGSGIAVSHLGIGYKQHFGAGDTIYQQITCHLDGQGVKACVVTPQVCESAEGCDELMFLHATDAYPNGYYYSYSDKSNSYYCTKDVPEGATKIGFCNRVMSLPLGRYMAQKQYGKYIYMESPSIVGVHVEKILPPKTQ